MSLGRPADGPTVSAVDRDPTALTGTVGASGDGAPRRAEPVLDVRGISVGYDARPVVLDLSLSVGVGEIVALMGPNGAGKTTTLLGIVGALPLMGGTVLWGGREQRQSLTVLARQGLAFISEDRSIFMQRTARENLRIGRASERDALSLFPELRERLDVKAGLLSGGEQQMLTIARALARRPKTLVVDELSLGLAPLVVERLLDALKIAAWNGTGVLLVEQYIHKALSVADRGLVMIDGRIVLEGNASDLVQRVDEIESTYLATNRSERSVEDGDHK
jgi:branched-chain amino acid transport system ATP-binding protein